MTSQQYYEIANRAHDRGAEFGEARQKMMDKFLSDTGYGMAVKISLALRLAYARWARTERKSWKAGE